MAAETSLKAGRLSDLCALVAIAIYSSRTCALVGKLEAKLGKLYPASCSEWKDLRVKSFLRPYEVATTWTLKR